MRESAFSANQIFPNSFLQLFHPAFCEIRLFGRNATFPDNDNLPAKIGKRLSVSPVARLVAFYLSLPKFRPAFRQPEMSTIFMAMPKTAMNEDRRPVTPQDDIGFPGKLATMETEPEPRPVKQFSKQNLRFGVGTLDA